LADPIAAAVTDALRRLAARLPGAALEILPGTGHELLREADRYRLPVIERIDGFLERTVRAGSATPAPTANRKVRT
jgi:alpha-beta hydrolase superfamily lysophospholipase